MEPPAPPPVVFDYSADWVQLTEKEDPKTFGESAAREVFNRAARRPKRNDLDRLAFVLEQSARAAFEVGCTGAFMLVPNPEIGVRAVVRLLAVPGELSRDQMLAQMSLPDDWLIATPDVAEMDTRAGIATRIVQRAANYDVDGSVMDYVHCYWIFEGRGAWILSTGIRDFSHTAECVAAIEELARGMELQAA